MRVLCIGLDAATFDLILPWVREGKLPHLNNLMEEGWWGELTSVQPPFSAPAWASFLSGKNPGKHGVYGFKGFDPKTRELPFCDARSIHSKTIAHLMSEAGKHTILLNVPMTFPPTQLKNTIIVSGPATPGVASPFTYPPRIKQEILRETGGKYAIDVHWSGYFDGSEAKVQAAVREVFEMIGCREKAARYLMEKYLWDLFVVVFTEPDEVQHYFWKYMDTSHPHYRPEEAAKFGDVILRVYQRLDEAVGRLRNLAGKDATCIVMSDHGAGPLSDKTIFVNEWLRREGLMVTKDKSAPSAKTLLHRAVRAQLEWVWQWLARKLSSQQKDTLVRLFPKLRAKVAAAVSLPDIDWSRTKAYVAENVNTIRLNVNWETEKTENRETVEYERLRDYIISSLLKLKDPETGEAVIEAVYKREEIYHGPFMTMAPDLLIVPRGWRYDVSKKVLNRPNAPIAHRCRNWRGLSGSHRPNGILIAAGPAIKSMVNGQWLMVNDYHLTDNQPSTINHQPLIVDLAPTLLYLLDLPIPSDMDGRVLEELLADELLKSRPVRWTGQSDVVEQGAFTYSAEDASRVNERLRSLGYIEE